MSADRNKTELTLRATESAAYWLAGIGAKPIEAEVFVESGWIADLAGMWRPTRTEAQRLKLIPNKRQGPRQWQEWWSEREKVYSSLPNVISIVCEVKTSVGDFRSDDKWNRQPPADMRVLVLPKGMIPSKDWPGGWWIVLTDERGSVITTARHGTLTPSSDARRCAIAVNLAERRHNRTAYAFWRDQQKSHANHENERINRERIERVIDVITEYLEGDTKLDDHLWRLSGYQHYAPKLSKSRRRRIEQLKQRLQSSSATEGT